MLDAAAQAYSDVFAPELFVLYCVVLLAAYELRGGDAALRPVAARLGAIAAGWVLAYAVVAGVPQVVDASAGWREDVVESVALVLGLGAIWLAWRRRSWGECVPRFVALLVLVTVPHVLVVPFWDVSGHVLYATTSAGALLAADRRFLPLVVVPLGMVASRPLAGAHTWPQAVGGLLLGAAVVLAAHVVWDARRLRGVPT